MGRRLHVGTFEDEHTLLTAVRACNQAGVEVVDVITPYPLHGLDEELGLRRSRLPWVCLAGGAAGLAIGLWFQYWSSATDWPIDVGGRPFDSLPAFMVVAFEMTILIAGLTTAAALLWRNRLWPGRKPDSGLERSTDDGLLLVLREGDASFAPGTHAALLREHGASEIREEVTQ